MFFRDELLSWSWRRPLGMPSAPAAAGGISPLDFEQKVTMNVEHVISRVKGIAPLYSDKRRKNPDKEIMRMDVWLETHTKKDGSASCEEMDVGSFTVYY